MRRARGGKDFRGVVVYPMIRDAQEVLMGITRDPQFGPVVAFGLGGIYTEVLRDFSLRVAPIDRGEALAMIREIRSFPIFQESGAGAPARSGCARQHAGHPFPFPFLYPEIAEKST